MALTDFPVGLTIKQKTWLRQESKRTGSTMAEVLRRMIDARVDGLDSKERKAADLKGAQFELFVRGKGIYDDCATFAQMIARLETSKECLAGFQRDGLALAEPVADDYARLLTNDKKTAKKYSMLELGTGAP